MIQAVSNVFRRVPLRSHVPLALLILISGAAGNLTLPDTDSGDDGLADVAALAISSRSLFLGNPSTWSHVEIDPALVDDETLWLARCIFSETKDVDEMELVAWVVRNRVETGYRGRRTYRGVVLDPFQFSAFNRNSTKRYFYSNLGAESSVVGWATAVRVAYQVRTDAGARRPFPATTRHFFSERSMTGRSQPSWAHGLTPVGIDVTFEVPEERFRFYDGIL